MWDWICQLDPQQWMFATAIVCQPWVAVSWENELVLPQVSDFRREDF